MCQHQKIEQRSYDHGACDGNAVCAGQSAGLLESDDDAYTGNHQGIVDNRNIDLSLYITRRMDNAYPGTKTQLRCLLGQRKSAGNQSLRSNHGCGSSQADHGIEKNSGDKLIEGINVQLRVCQQ